MCYRVVDTGTELLPRGVFFSRRKRKILRVWQIFCAVFESTPLKNTERTPPQRNVWMQSKGITVAHFCKNALGAPDWATRSPFIF
mmetsp:Transcript_12597/g.37169  ORF Transcript_12597/g.37169 Transcript_12597/m.37169 type:complete len:85 (+) Transcript_12597:3837-4091(+)